MSRAALVLVVVLPPLVAATAVPVPQREGPPITCTARPIPFPSPPPPRDDFDVAPADDGLLFEVRLTNRTPRPIRLTAECGAWGLIYPRVTDAHGKEVSNPGHPFFSFSVVMPDRPFVLRPGEPFAVSVHALKAVYRHDAPPEQSFRCLPPGRYQVEFRFREPIQWRGPVRYEAASPAYPFEVPATP